MRWPQRVATSFPRHTHTQNQTICDLPFTSAGGTILHPASELSALAKTSAFVCSLPILRKDDEDEEDMEDDDENHDGEDEEMEDEDEDDADETFA